MMKRKLFYALLIIGLFFSCAGSIEKNARAYQTAPSIKTFFIGGQSNAEGFAAVPQQQAIRVNIKVWTPTGWKVASEPLQGTYAGPGMGFATALQDLYGANYEIRLISCAVSGSKIEDWQRGQVTYSDCLAKTLAALASQPGNGLSGVLFLQGEANTYTQASADGWNALALAFARDFRTDTGNLAIPFLYAQLGADPQLATHPYWTYLQTLQATLQNPSVYPYIRMVKTNDLPTNQQHFVDAATYSIVGRRFASVYFSNFGQ